MAFAGSGSDPDGNLPLQFLWQFGAGSGVPDYSVKDPGLVQFPNSGVFTVGLTVSDAKGYADPTPATRKVTVSYSGASLIPKSGWVLRYFDSRELLGKMVPQRMYLTETLLHFGTRRDALKTLRRRTRSKSILAHSTGVEALRYLPRQDGESTEVSASTNSM